MANSHDIVSHPFTASLIKRKAAQLCRRTDFSRSDSEDLQQEMALYLLEKARLFDAERGNLEAFVTTAINSWVAMHLRHRAREKRRDGFRAVSLEATMIEHDGEADTLGSVVSEADLRRRTRGSGASPLDMVNLRDEARAVLAALAPDERALLAVVADHGPAGAARRLDLSRRKVEGALARMRARFEDKELGTD